MSDYRRFFVPGGTYFFTLVAYQRRPRFAQPSDVQRLRDAVAFVQREQPFRFLAAVILPDHMHFVWTLPPGDSDYSRRIGRMKVHFTRSCDTAAIPRRVGTAHGIRTAHGSAPGRKSASRHRVGNIGTQTCGSGDSGSIRLMRKGSSKPLSITSITIPSSTALRPARMPGPHPVFRAGLPAGFMSNPGDAVASGSGTRRATSPALKES